MSDLYDTKEIPDVTFHLYFKLTELYQRQYLTLTEKLTGAEYSMGSFRVVRNTIKVVMYKDKIFILQKFQKYVVKWYHTYIFHPGLDLTEDIILQHLYCTGIRISVQKEVTGCETCQLTKLSKIKYSELPDKLAKETP